MPPNERLRPNNPFSFPASICFPFASNEKRGAPRRQRWKLTTAILALAAGVPIPFSGVRELFLNASPGLVLFSAVNLFVAVSGGIYGRFWLFLMHFMPPTCWSLSAAVAP